MTRVHTMIRNTPLGPIGISADDEGRIMAVDFIEEDRVPADGVSAGTEANPVPGAARGALEEAARQLSEYFRGERREFRLPIGAAGTAFRLRVWEELSGIPYGEVISYGELARRVGRPGGARAVGLACGSNPIAVIVPCHRVIAGNSRLNGYAAGLARKRRLLELEGHRICGDRIAATGVVRR